MKITQIIAMALMMEVGARADQVTVCVEGLSVVPKPVLSGAQVLANEIFAGAGVEIDWQQCKPARAQTQRERPIWIEMSTNTPRQRMPGALAFAFPDVGGRITVFYDRVEKVAQFELTPNALLSHVMVHEIAHMLEGSDRHSNGGVMKATYSQKDIRSMRWRPLPFSEEDVQAIRAGLAQRADAYSMISVFPAP